MARRTDRLITHIRSITENDTTNSTTDIQDSEIIEYMNEGLHRIQGRILAQHPNVFLKEKIIDSVSEQEEYQLPSDVFMASKVISVEYSTDNGTTYYKLRPSTWHKRNSHISGMPKYYIRKDDLNDNTGSLLLSPKPSSSSQKIRVIYVQRIDEVDKRRGIVSAVTLDSGTSTITTLTLDTSGNPPIDSDDLDKHDYICVVDTVGNLKMRNIQFDSISSSTGAVTVNSSFTYDTGESIAVGDYIVGGLDTTSHARIPRNIERYMVNFAAWKMMKRDSSIDAQEQFQELAIIENEIIESYQEINEDINFITVVEDFDEWL